MKTNEKKKRNAFIYLSILGTSALIAGLLVFDASRNGGSLIKLVKSGLDDYRFAFSSGKQYRDTMDGNNATERFIQSYGSQIALKNPSGPEGQTLTLPSQEIFDTLLAKEVSAGIAYEAINESDIRTVADSKESVSQYLSSLRRITGARKADLWRSIFQFSQDGDARSLLAYAAESKTAATELAALAVPASWKNFHVDLVNFERKRITTVRAIASSDEDPVKGLAGMEELTNLNETELKLAETFAEKTKGI